MNKISAELEKQYYGAMIKGYYDTRLLIERNIATWGSLAIGGLLAFGISERRSEGFSIPLWAIAIGLFITALTCSLWGLITSAKHNSEEIEVFPEFIKDYWEQRRFIKFQNWATAGLFILGVIVSAVLIIRFTLISSERAE
jgi:hypothetical protein